MTLVSTEWLQSKSKEGDYKSVREAIASKLETDDYDDGANCIFLSDLQCKADCFALSTCRGPSCLV